MSLRSFIARTATVACALAFSGSALGSVTSWDETVIEGVSLASANESDALRVAYHLLSRGNNSYAGSRVLAMDYIRNAGRTVGLKLEGVETSKEDHSLSDERFRAARRLLEAARSRLAAAGNEDAVANVDEALMEITLALTLEPIPPDLHRAPIALDEADREALKTAYITLYSGNHRYGGHRRAAMFKIQAAGRLAGVTLRGDGEGNEDARASELRIQIAKGLLEGVRANLTKPEQAPVRIYVDLALARLHRATDHSVVSVLAE